MSWCNQFADKYRLTNTLPLLTLLLVPFFLPLTLAATGAGVDVYTLPYLARYKLEASYSMVGTIVSARALGHLATAPCLGFLVARLGGQLGFVVASLWSMCGALASALAVTPLMLLVVRFLSGPAFGMFQIARQLFIAENIEPAQRGKLTALVVGTTRLGSALGPILAGYNARFLGSVRADFYLAALLHVASALLFYQKLGDTLSVALRRTSLSKITPVLDQPPDLFPPIARKLGVVSFTLALARSSREILLPLIAHDAGLGRRGIGAVTSLSFTVDMCLAPVAGFVIDRYGRKGAGVPALCVLALGFGALGFASTPHLVFYASILVGVGNGLSNGWVAVVGADIAPPAVRAKFLGLWTFVFSLGNAVGPLLVGGISDLVDEDRTKWHGLSISCFMQVGLCLLGALFYYFFAPETLPNASPRGDAPASAPATAGAPATTGAPATAGAPAGGTPVAAPAAAQATTLH